MKDALTAVRRLSDYLERGKEYFSILFDTVENRKLRHQMERKYMENAVIKSEE